MMRDYYYPFNNWMCGGGSIFGGYMIIVWLFLIGIIILFALKSRPQQADKKSENSALHILKERYAKGDITKKEFEEMKKDIS